MGTYTNRFYARLARREMWRRRLKILGNVALAALAAVTIYVVMLALQR